MPSKRFQLDKYRNEALRPDFELVIGPESSIVIKPPTVDEVIDLSGMSDVRAQIQILAKEQYEPLMEAIGGEPGAMLQSLMDEMMKLFGLMKQPTSPT